MKGSSTGSAELHFQRSPKKLDRAWMFVLVLTLIRKTKELALFKQM